MNQGTDVVVRRFGPDDWQIKREVRLAALAADAQWFGGNYADSARRTQQQWQQWPGGGASFGAFIDGRARGIVACPLSGHLDGEAAELIAMWVDPAFRGRGVASALITAVVDWASELGAECVYLEVKPNNTSAVGAYTRFGFAETQAVAHEPGNLVLRYRLDARQGH